MTVADFEKAKSLFDRIKECDTVIKRLEHNSNNYLLLPVNIIDGSFKETTKEEKFEINTQLSSLIVQFYKDIRDQCIAELDKM